MAEVVCKWVKRVRGNMNPHLKSLLNNGYMISIRTQRLFMKSHTEAHNRSIKANVRGDCSALIHLASSLYVCVQHNADYVNWLICENNQSQGGTHRRGGTTELVYVTLDFSRRKSDMWDVFFLQWLSVCPHICCVGGSRAGLTVSPAGSSRPARTITQTWFTARCAGKGQEALIHLRNNYLLKADYVQTSSFSFSGTELWTRHRVCSNRCTHVFTVLVYLFFLFPYMSEICKMYCTRIAVKTNIMIQTATKHVLQLYLKRKDPTKSHKGDAHLGIKA